MKENAIACPETIKKRNGTPVPFDVNKIRSAIHKANEAAQIEAIAPVQFEKLVDEVVESIPAGQVPDVEQVQDLVEEKLIANGFAKTAKAYILYRAEHTKVRKTEVDLVNIYRELTFTSAADADIKRENANIDADTSMGTMLKYGSEGANYFVDNYILPKDIAAAHINGDIHIHDKDFYMLTETCCQIDLVKLFHDGFSTGHGFIRQPKSIASYAALACIAIQANQNEMHGGQSVPNFDYAMAEGVACTFRKEYYDAVQRYFWLEYDCENVLGEAFRSALKDAMPDRINMSNIDDHEELLVQWLLETGEQWLGKTPAEEEIRRCHKTSIRIAMKETDQATYQAMESLIHNLNTMNSRAGAQVPFSSINYGTCTSPEARMAMKNLLKVTDIGLGNGETAIFPVQIFKVKEGINYNPGDPNYDLFRLAIKVSAKRLFPNFSFIDAPFNLPYYKEGDYNTEIAYMGCRTRVMGNHYDPTKEVTCGRGNLSFTSINLPRLGILAKGNMDKFYKLLDKRLALCCRQLLHRFGIQSKKTVKNYPFLMGQGIWIDSDKLNINDEVGEVLKHGTLSVGFIGLAETLVALTGKHHGESEESRKLGLEIIGHMRKYMDDESEKTGLNFTLLATPAEGLSGRFVRIDQKRFGKIPGVTDREYYTNSFHVPVYYPIGAFQKIKIEAPYHALTNAGHISYVELDGDTAKNPEAFEAIIRCMKESGIGYGSVNHPVDRDPVCGFTGVIDDVCPRCGRHEGEAVSIERLNELRKKYPDIPVYFDPNH
ncbi:anaerobic ribonucleoside triphosphate reductase [Hominiventricola filiformis]|uniref:Anaerobic ribonucleoside triphosphate reductase n=1 Tax=Hominiventricola filiformis TaxID=2885352 RepID=A0AAE3ACN5_9FIRM|nr:anaerobic ribonucleoside triphosphate reductase [Hominiventricola filiformis]MCC2127613.1 anaerobic ribonucleoside triphosphate reductase [Hominiventricola filiformis]QUO21676.1 anaerobic ribonucleoside triphosphate reductase [Clostridiaceae bacterium Marseille-Q4143]